MLRFRPLEPAEETDVDVNDPKRNPPFTRGNQAVDAAIGLHNARMKSDDQANCGDATITSGMKEWGMPPRLPKRRAQTA